MNNNTTICGTIVSEPHIENHLKELTHKFTIAVPRLSGTIDYIPTIMMYPTKNIRIGSFVRLYGRTVTELQNGHLNVLFNAYIEICGKELTSTNNCVYLDGYICKKPVVRTTPLGRHICDVILAVNCDKSSSYIPCVFWGRNAELLSNSAVGDRISLRGRFQSREYNKKYSEEYTETKTAYEISVEAMKYEKGTE